MIIVCKRAFGKHVNQQVPLDRKTLKVMYKMVIALSKISIVLLYLRIFFGKLIRRYCWLIISLVTCYTVDSTTATVFQYSPIHRAWDRRAARSCINMSASWVLDKLLNVDYHRSTRRHNICACMPTYKAPLSKMFPGIFNSFYNSKNVAEPKRDSRVDRSRPASFITQLGTCHLRH
ncbi:hypothetical protein PAAG_07214 [Paracoccidioides lutzii Pb01]|uniref:Rhodopsin domain-containing protein n=1 Tax=Paracoccidioides lutzii (strain ATCC MYA-826 / Pb01) TaxID=502779 RepID=C1H8X3_PARBA|nr:hypothetical protein PAAG_07214 [Paracoccidioides lutzii Pb01]EEH36796.2 hypothetical protein PAAG_07214 [Paracoccidioides lutzii Pb01]